MADKKLLLIGWDAADWRMIRPLLDTGKMPHLAAMMQSGVAGNLATLRPPLSPMLWTSIATGKYCWKHGIHGFCEPDPNTGNIRPVTNLSRKTKAIWNILCQQGKTCHVVGWWPSHPAEPIDGVMVSNRFQHAAAPPGKPWPVLPGSVHPTRLIKHLAPLRMHPAEVDGDTLLPLVPRAPEIDQEKDRRLFALAKIIAETATVHAVATGLMQLEPWDCMAVYYDGIDHFGHGFMKFHPPRRESIREHDFELYKDVMENAYRFHDMMLGTLLELAGEESTVMLISDHGFHPDHLRPAGLPNAPAGPAAEHRGYGIFVMKGPGIASGRRVAGATLLDICPTILHDFGLPVGKDMDGQVLLAAYNSPAPVQTIASWDDVPGEDGMHPPDTRLDPQDASAAIRQLVDLGYIEEPNADRRRGMEEITQELRYNLAQAYMGAGRFADALAIMEELWQARPAESRFGLQVLLCRIALKDAAGARTTYRQLVKARREDSLHARKELKALLQAKKDAGQHAKDWSEQERRQIRRVRARTRTDRTSLAFHEAQIRFVEGRYEEALQKFEKLEAHASPDRRVSLYVRMAECNLLLGRHAEAEKHFHQALDLDAECAPAHLGLTRCLLAQQRGLEAAAAALNARDLDSGNPRAHFFYGEAMAATRHFQWAADAYHEALRLHPSFTEAHLRLAALYETRLKHPERARKHRQQATAAEKRIQSIPGNVLHPVDTVRSKFNAKAKTEPLPPFNRTGRVDVPPAQWIIVVTGLPRSGTSMLMQMLQAGGIPVFADEKRRSDVSNERGYYEYERVKQLARESDWLAGARGHAIKIVIPLMRYFPLQLHAKVLVVEREMAAVLASQAKMLERQQQSAQPVQHGGLERIYRTYQRQTGAFLRRHPRIDGLTLRYDEILAEPATAAAAVAAFLDIPDLDAGKMARAVQPGLRHEYARS